MRASARGSSRLPRGAHHHSEPDRQQHWRRLRHTARPRALQVDPHAVHAHHQCSRRALRRGATWRSSTSSSLPQQRSRQPPSAERHSGASTCQAARRGVQRADQQPQRLVQWILCLARHRKTALQSTERRSSSLLTRPLHTRLSPLHTSFRLGRALSRPADSRGRHVAALAQRSQGWQRKEASHEAIRRQDLRGLTAPEGRRQREVGATLCVQKHQSLRPLSPHALEAIRQQLQ